MSGLLALVGGQEHTRGCEPIDQLLLAESGVRRPNVVVLLAATTEGRRAYKTREALEYWSRFGARVTFGFDGSPSEVERALRALDDPDLVVLTGGRPWLLDARLQEPLRRRLWELWESGVPLAGSSAGAMALCGWRFVVHPPRLPRLAPGWGPVPAAAVAPHFERHGIRYWSRLFAVARPDVKVLGLSDRTALVGRGEDFEVVGSGGCTVVTARSRARRYGQGEVLHLGAIVEQLRAQRTAESAEADRAST